VRSRRHLEGEIGAAVLGGDYQGLGIIRSLGRHGVKTCIIDDERSIGRFSRYATYSIRVPEMRDERQTAEAVLKVGRELDLKGWVLFPTRDENVAAISRYRESLLETFRVPTPDWNRVQWAWDKRNTYRIAERLGIPTPRTWYPCQLHELAAIDVEMPLVIKPAIKEHFIYATKAKAWRANTPDELKQLFTQASAYVGAGELMVQDLVPGDGRQQFAWCAFFKNGQALGSMTVRRTRQHPPEFGRASTFVETVDLPVLRELSERLLRHIDYYGLVEMEYKLDPRDDQYKLLDVNARTWGYHSIGSAAGVDFPYMLFADQLGQSVEPCQAQPGIGWIRLLTDIPAAILETWAGRLHWSDYLRSLKLFSAEAVFCREDVLPGIVELGLIPYLFLKRGF